MAVAREPIAIFAILVTLVPFSYERIQDVFFATAEIEVECRTPRDDQFLLDEGYLYYKTRCLLINKSDQAVSVVSLLPTMQSGSHPHLLVGGRTGLPQISETTTPILHALFAEMEQEIPLNIRNLEAHAIDVVFATHVDKIRPYRDRNGCAKSMELDSLSSMTICFSDDAGSHPAERNRPQTIKTQIYRGWSYGFFDVDGFGLQMTLGDGRGYLIEADLTLASGYECDEDIRQLNCRGRYGADRPKVISLGTASSDGIWQSWTDKVGFFIVIFVFAITVTLAISLLTQIVRWIKVQIVSFVAGRKQPTPVESTAIFGSKSELSDVEVESLSESKNE